MKRMHLLLVWLTMVMAPALQASAAASDATTSATTPIAGAVQDAQGKPVAQAEVTLIEVSSLEMGQRIVATRKTGADGKFRFEAAPAQTDDMVRERFYQLLATKQGLAWGMVYRSPLAESEPLTISLLPASPVAGQVVDRQGKPVSGAWVYPMAYKQGAPATHISLRIYQGMENYAARTDAQGRFRFTQIPEGSSVGFQVDHPDYGQLAIQPYSQGPRLTAGDEKINLELGPPCSLHGRLTDATGQPKADIRLSLFGKNYLPSTVKTDANGHFAFDRITAGEYTIMPRLTPDQTRTGLIARHEAIKVEEKQKVEGIELKWVPGQALRGRVLDATTGKPVQGATVMASQRPVNPMAGGQGWSSGTQVDAEGKFELRVPEGEVSLNTYAKDYSSMAGKSQQTLGAKAGDAPREVTLYLKSSPPMKVTGIVLSPDGKPVPGATIRCGTFPPTTAQSDAQGRFIITVTRRNMGMGEEQLILAAVTPAGDLAGAAPLPENAGANLNLTIELKKAGAVAGRILDENKKPLAGAQVALMNRVNVGGGFSLRQAGEPIVTGPDGKFRVSGLSEGALYGIQLNANARGSFTDYNIKGQAGKTIDKGDIELPKADAFVDLTVIDQGGQPVEGVRVYAYGEKQPQSNPEQMTDKNGKLKLGPLVAGVLRVNGNKQGYTYVQASLQLTAGKTQALELEITREGGESLRLTSGAAVPRLEGVAWLKEPVDLAALKGRAVALVFFAPGNRPSRVALSRLSKLTGEYKDKLAVVAVADASGSAEELDRLWTAQGYPFAGGRVGDERKAGWASPAFRAFEVRALPSIVLIGPDGRIHQNEVSLGRLEQTVRTMVKGIK